MQLMLQLASITVATVADLPFVDEALQLTLISIHLLGFLCRAVVTGMPQRTIKQHRGSLLFKRTSVKRETTDYPRITNMPSGVSFLASICLFFSCVIINNIESIGCYKCVVDAFPFPESRFRQSNDGLCSSTQRLWSSSKDDNEKRDQSNSNKSDDSNNELSSSTTTGKPVTPPRKTRLSALTSSDPIVLREQAEMLRAEADEMRLQLQQSAAEKEIRRIERVDKLIDDILVCLKVDEDTQMLNTEERVAELIQDGRLSVENINSMFDRICEQSNRRQSMENHSPLIALLLDAACMVDCIEREDNPNKRWNQRVERDLRKKLFAMGWGIDIDEVNRERRVRSITGEKDV